MPSNLQEVAKLSGVSRSTVSRVVNNDPNVKDETRERVEAIMRQLNYQPNAAARSLAAGRTRVLGLVIPMRVSSLFTDPYFPQLIQGVSSACNALEYSVMLWIAEPEYERRTARQVLSNGLVDGVIIASSQLDDPVVNSLIESSLPFILVGRLPEHPIVSYVDVDNIHSAAEAVMHLFRLGRRRVATITGPLNMIAGADRLEGYQQALHQRGLTVNHDLIAEGDFTEDGGYWAMQKLLSQNPDAVFVASDAMTQGAYRALREAGRQVPQDIAVVGFDDMPFAARMSPALTTVRQPTIRVGALAAETLIDMVSDEARQPRRLVLPTELVIRASCGASY